nr:beta-ketoacyl synthase N-terminal-like domain-containing protein [Prosthecobacter dejongeii]
MPGSLNIRETDPAVCFDLVHAFREAPVKVALTNSFGFGGTNATLVFTGVDAPTSGAAATPAPHRPLHILGAGAVSAAGWGTAALATAITEKATLPTQESPRTVGTREWECLIRPAPPAPADRLPKFPRLRRASPITKFSMAAALEALEQAGYPQAQGIAPGRLGIVQLMFNGCVQFSGKFYHEVIETPTLASPLIFPETVYNAPASHIAAYLGVDGPATTLIGESSAIIEAIALAHTWLTQGLVDHVLVIGAEECDWLGAEATSYYHPQLQASEGAGVLLLSLTPGPEGKHQLRLRHTPALAYHHEAGKAAHLQALATRPEYNQAQHITGLSGIPLLDHAETAAHLEMSADTPVRIENPSGEAATPGQTTRLHPRQILGETMGAAGALQLVLAATLARQTSQPVSLTLPGSLCAAYGAVVEVE